MLGRYAQVKGNDKGFTITICARWEDEALQEAYSEMKKLQI